MHESETIDDDRYNKVYGAGYSPYDYNDDSKYRKDSPDLSEDEEPKEPVKFDQEAFFNAFLGRQRSDSVKYKRDEFDDDADSSKDEDEDNIVNLARKNLPTGGGFSGKAGFGNPQQRFNRISDESAAGIEEESKEADKQGGMPIDTGGATSGPRPTLTDVAGNQYREGDILDRVNELDPDRGRGEEEEEQSVGGAGLDPKYVKEAKRGALSRFFSPTLQTRKEKRGFGDKLKGFFSGLGEFGVWALTGLQTGAIGMGYRAKKNYHRWRANANAQKLARAERTKDEAAAKTARLKIGAHQHRGDMARHEQLRIGEHSSGYHWRKRMGQRFLTRAEQSAHLRVGGSEDWRAARDELQLIDQDKPGGRFARTKLARTKEALAAQKAVARAQARGAGPEQLAQLQAASQSAVQGAESAHMQDPMIKRATQRMNSRQSNIRGGEKAFAQVRALDKNPQMDVIAEDDEKSEDEVPQNMGGFGKAGRDSVLDGNGNLILDDESVKEEEDY